MTEIVLNMFISDIFVIRGKNNSLFVTSLQHRVTMPTTVFIFLDCTVYIRGTVRFRCIFRGMFLFLHQEYFNTTLNVCETGVKCF
jgi:hypothetical protein